MSACLQKLVNDRQVIVTDPANGHCFAVCIVKKRLDLIQNTIHSYM